MDEHIPLAVQILGVALYFMVLVLGYLLGVRRSRQSQQDTDLLDFLEATGYSLQCVRAAGGDGTWAVTDGANHIVGVPSPAARGAVESAANGGAHGG